MRTVKLLLSAMLCLALLMVPVMNIFAQEVPPEGAEPEAALPLYAAAKGKIVACDPYVDTDGNEVPGRYFVRIEDEAGNPIMLCVDEDTWRNNQDALVIGGTVIGFYRTDLPMILIYPPQFHVDALIVNPAEGKSYIADRFDEALLSQGNLLQLLSTDQAEILRKDGTPYTGELGGCALLVEFGAATRSLPPQTNPDRIVVLLEAEPETGSELPDGQMFDVAQCDLVVNDKRIEAPPAAYFNEQGVVMVPLRVIAEALALEVHWEETTSSVRLGEQVSLQIGKDHYVGEGADPIELGAAPELHNERTYVPLSFFKKVLGMNNAYVFEGQIVIDNNELMH
ncbi:MAG: copper amine oxidase N-terminal domain-containing protein [Clostridiales bacterium]|nr:copper amine oxidase N-terminal domain-containing protein [Clostridiales bacterium]